MPTEKEFERLTKRVDKHADLQTEIRESLAGINATLPHLATKEDVANVRTAVSDVRGLVHKYGIPAISVGILSVLGIIAGVAKLYGFV